MENKKVLYPSRHKATAMLITICLAIAFNSCDNRREIYEDETISVNVTLDWEPAGIRPVGTTLWFFPHTEGRTPKVLRTNGLKDLINLPRDLYSVLVFNETESDHDYISFRGTDHYETFEAYVSPIPNTTVKSESIYDMPDMLAVARMEKLDLRRIAHPVTEEPVYLTFVPTPLVAVGTLDVYLRGMDNVRLRSSRVTLSGMAQSINLATEKVSDSGVTHAFGFSNRQFSEGSFTDGTMTANCWTIGACANVAVPCVVNLYLGLRDGTAFTPIVRNISNQMRASGLKTRVHSTFRIEFGTGATADDPIITIPYVPDNEESGSGFDATIDDWGEETEITIPMS